MDKKKSLEPGWLARQLEIAKKDVESRPVWMKVIAAEQERKQQLSEE